MAFLDATGCLMPPASEPWKEHNVPEEKDEKEKQKKRRPVSVSPSSSQEISENQYAVICSEKQAKVISLPTQNCAYKQNITETSFVLRGDIVALSNSVCLACFCANGHIMTFRYKGSRFLTHTAFLLGSQYKFCLKSINELFILHTNNLFLYSNIVNKGMRNANSVSPPSVK